MRLGPSLLAGAVYCVVNVGLLTLAMSIAEDLQPLAVWRERFRWFTPYYLASGPLAARTHLRVRERRPRRTARLHDAAGDDDALDPAVRQPHAPVGRRHPARERRAAPGELCARGAKRRPARAVRVRGRTRSARPRPRVARRVRAGGAGQPDRHAGARRTSALAEARRSSCSSPAGSRSARSQLDETAEYDETRWKRLREALLPQLATALESAELVEQVRKTHLQTIAALVALDGGEGLLHRRPYRARRDDRGRARTPARLLTAPTSTRSRSARCSTTSARSASPSASCTSPARSTTRSGR